MGHAARATERWISVVEVTIEPVCTPVAGDHVVVEAISDGTTTSGDRCDSTDVDVLELSDGRVRSLREDCDTERAADAPAPAMTAQRNSRS